ncbi:MAG: N-6 DNA methylase [Bacteroidia bacterium]|nr:N-6 DNA methylase [Bacteroidia bacterium]
MIKDYLTNISNTTILGDAREKSYYGHLSVFLKEFAGYINTGNISITTLPKKTEAGNPDFRIWDGKLHIVGYIEAKRPGENLDLIENSEQLFRYRNTFPNLILTDFYEFRLYRNGIIIDKVIIGRQFLPIRLKTIPPVENELKFKAFLEKFFSFSVPHLYTAETLAVELAKRTRFLRDEVISIELAEEEKNGKKCIIGFYEAFRKYLINALSEKQFADLYAQTITYGLFAARTRATDRFNRELAFKHIPDTIGILKDIFRFISLEDPPLTLQIMVDDIAEVLNNTDIKKILQDYFKEGKGEDPIVHFYETFLTAYDPVIREKKGVYYTPVPVVNYIVRSIHQVLKSHFGLSDGFASPAVTLLDPAAGTLTFPAQTLKIAIEEYTSKYGEGGKNNLIKNHILPNYYAFELMMAPYAIGHLKMSFLLEEIGYKLQNDERFKFYLTNTLEMEDLEQIQIPGLRSLSEESHLAGAIKRHQSILVIIGNPPYSGHSENRNKWTEYLLKKDIDNAQSYYKVDGQPLKEKNPKWLQDDYVKFLRFAQWKIHKAGFGIVGMITNHSYLDNPTFRGMRQSLIKTFNEIYIHNLHGNSLKKETGPEGTKDENVFDIRQGVSIALFIKLKNKKDCKVYYTDVYGLRENKYKWLNENNFGKKNFDKINPEPPFYFFIKRNIKGISQYLTWKPVNEIFRVNSVGIVTARDNLTIKFSEQEIWNTVLNFSKMEKEIARQAYSLGEDTSDWKIELAQSDLKHSGPDRKNIKPILYRPFDIRYTYYTGNSRGFHCRPRNDIMRHMLNENLGLTIGRAGQVVGLEYLWNLVFVSRNIIDLNLFYRGGELIFPLYLYKEKKSRKFSIMPMLVCEPEIEYGYKNRVANIDKIIYEKLNKTYKSKLSPEAILYYIYSIFYCNIFREKYGEFLKIDFPRIPFTTNFNLFRKLAEFGNKLSDLHLMKSKLLSVPVSKYHGTDDNDRIEKINYVENKQCVYINKEKYFDGISSELWNYNIGGYKILEKYLQDRKTRIMDAPEYYCKIITAINETIILQKKIDLLYEEVENEIIYFK